MKKIIISLCIIALGWLNCEAAQPEEIAVTSIVITPADCLGRPSGSITLTIDGGNATSFNYIIDDQLISAANPDTTFTFTNLAADQHVIQVQDNGEPENRLALEVPVGAGSPVVVTNIAINNAECGFPTGTGSIALTTSGGVEPVEFFINGQSHDGSGVFQGLAPLGYPLTYNIQITSGGDCPTSQYLIPISGPAPVAVSFDTTGTTCFGAPNGQITITNIIGGTPPYRVILDNNNNQELFVPGQNLVFSNLSGGAHVITVVDENECRYPIIVQVPSPSLLFAQTTVTPVSCNGGSDGAITIEAITGGEAPYFFSFNGSPFVQFTGPVTFSNLTAKIYTIAIQDSSSTGPCTIQQAVEVPQQTEFQITDVITTPVTGNSLGSLFVVVTPGFGGVEFSIGGPFQISPLFENLPAGTYTVTARVDDRLCAVATAVIAPAPLTATVSVINPVCIPGGAAATVGITATGGFPPYQYSINGGASFQSSPVFTGVVAGIYTVVVKDSQGNTASQIVQIGTVIPSTGNPLTDFLIQKFCRNCIALVR